MKPIIQWTDKRGAMHERVCLNDRDAAFRAITIHRNQGVSVTIISSAGLVSVLGA